jgi:hypothetical protein
MNLSQVKKFVPKSLLVVLALPAVAVAAMVIVSGVMYGRWDLPSTAGAGYAKGTFVDSSGNTVFKMKAKLSLLPTGSVLVEAGEFNGMLFDGSGSAWPQYSVAGKWFGSTATHKGSFKGEVFFQPSQMGPIGPIGTVSGKYSDTGLFSTTGKFKGHWKADL